MRIEGLALTTRLAVEIIKDFIALDPETQPRNVTAWTPVVTDILNGVIGFEETSVSDRPLCYIIITTTTTTKTTTTSKNNNNVVLIR